MNVCIPIKCLRIHRTLWFGLCLHFVSATLEEPSVGFDVSNVNCRLFESLHFVVICYQR
jgi:hypothetical protein